MFNRDDIGPGQVIAGPAIVEALDSTVWIPSNWSAVVDPSGNLIIDFAPAPTA